MIPYWQIQENFPKTGGHSKGFLEQFSGKPPESCPRSLPIGGSPEIVNIEKGKSTTQKARTVNFGFFCNINIVFLCGSIHIKESIMSKYRFYAIHTGKSFTHRGSSSCSDTSANKKSQETVTQTGLRQLGQRLGWRQIVYLSSSEKLFGIGRGRWTRQLRNGFCPWEFFRIVPTKGVSHTV